MPPYLVAETALLFADALLLCWRHVSQHAVVLRAVIALVVLLQQHRLRVAPLEAVRRQRPETELADVVALIHALVQQEFAGASSTLSCLSIASNLAYRV